MKIVILRFKKCIFSYVELQGGNCRSTSHLVVNKNSDEIAGVKRLKSTFPSPDFLMHLLAGLARCDFAGHCLKWCDFSRLSLPCLLGF